MGTISGYDNYIRIHADGTGDERTLVKGPFYHIASSFYHIYRRFITADVRTGLTLIWGILLKYMEPMSVYSICNTVGVPQ